MALQCHPDAASSCFYYKKFNTMHGHINFKFYTCRGWQEKHDADLGDLKQVSLLCITQIVHASETFVIKQ